jgi:uncharacterized protein YqfA (UPF0365 family)
LHLPEAYISPQSGFLLGVAVTLATLLLGWSLLRLTGPWLNARVNGIPLSLPELIGMRMRRSDAGLIVTTAVALSRLGEPAKVSELELAYLSLPDNQRNLTELMRSVRPKLTARLDAEARSRAAEGAT